MANERSLPSHGGDAPAAHSTRDALLDAALDRFSSHGFGGTSIRDLARDVGIRESSVYKHFPSKQAIFDSTIDRADDAFTALSDAMGVNATDPIAARAAYEEISTESLEQLAVAMLDAVAAEPRIRKLIAMLSIEQYRDAEANRKLRSYLLDTPIAFQTAVFTHLRTTGALRTGIEPSDAARAFWAPIACLLLTAQFDEAAHTAVRQHVRHFSRTHMEAS